MSMSTQNQIQDFINEITNGYTPKSHHLTLGAGMLESEVISQTQINIPLSTLNRHGLIAGATGTGKTKTLQMFAEQLSKAGIPSLVMDIKGDLSGISQAGVANDKITTRHQQIGIEWQPSTLPVEFMSISEQAGVRMRATVSEFGPVLFSKMLDLNDTQSGGVSLVFKYCDDHTMPLVDLNDFKQVLQFLTNEGKDQITKDYGQISSSTAGTIMRKIIELEEQNAEVLFGEKSFDIADLIRNDANGYGYISVLRLNDMQTKPKLFSTFMLSLLSELYQTLPEKGDIEKPIFCLFIDEAHLVFDTASKALLDQIEQIIKLIRSKGVGIYFITQNPIDIPATVLSQLGLKIQHALRAFTANDRKAIKSASENYPLTNYYVIDKVITELGIGEAFVTALNEKGIPTPLVRVMLRSPETRMDVITDSELNSAISQSTIASKYATKIDSQTASDILKQKIQKAVQTSSDTPTLSTNPEQPKKTKEPPSVLESVSKNTMIRQVARTAMREITRGLMGALFGGSKKR